MSAAPPQAPAETRSWAKPPRGRRRRRAAIAVGLTAVLAAGGAAIALERPFRATAAASTPIASSEYPTSLYTVTLQSLSSQTQVSATLGFAGSYNVTGQGGGTITWLPAAGQVIRQGGVLYRVDNGTPVFLLYGSVPMWRALSEGLTGADVRQLNRDLVALGYASKSELDPDSDYFSAETASALELLQAHLGLTQTGSLSPGQAVFLPSAIMVTTVQGSLGSPAGGAVLQASSTQRIVTVDLEATEQSDVQAGDKVVITLPDGQNTPGVVSSVGTVATTPSGGGTPTITVEVTPSDPTATGSLDQAPVEVSITTASVADAVVIPVDALLAEPGGYAVEEATAGGGRRLVPVTLGLFDDADGMVQVTGLAAGQRVVVPAL
jgi:peptidoglycan hydrolase-like protein with peptidoglycan-binding domain